MSRWVLLLLALAGGCAGDGSTPGDGCRSDADCDGGGGSYCFAPGEPNCPVEQSCEGVGCDPGQVCLPADPAVDACATAVCRDRCTDDAGCRTGVETCDVPSGECRPIPCDAGFACDVHETCVPGAPLHGCVRDGCTDDAGCAGGACVKDACYPRLGACGEQATN